MALYTSTNWKELTKWELTKWEDSPFEIILTTVIDHLCVSELLDKHIMKNIHGTLLPACSILSQVLTISTSALSTLTKWELTKWELTKREVDQMGIDEVGIDKVGITPQFYLMCIAHT